MNRLHRVADQWARIIGRFGLAKTLTVNALPVRSGSFQRVRSPDFSSTFNAHLQPEDEQFIPKLGPVLLPVLADEINRAPAKVQSALLEAMQEKQVTVGDTTRCL